MTPDDALGRRLERLPRLTPDANRAERVKARCRAQFERRHRRQARRESVIEFTSQVLAPAAVGGVCVIWVAFLVAFAFEFARLDHPMR
jgi:hypothetical protein